MLTMNHRPVADDGGDRVLEDQLLLAVVLQQHRVFVEGTDLARQLHSADKVDGDWSLIFADRIKKRVLNVLCRLVIHVPISPRRFLFAATNCLRNTEIETAAIRRSLTRELLTT